jgi:hypothetical protein
MLSHIVQTRSAQSATAEHRMVIEHREALIYMICEAAELEHGLMCEYLFAALSLKDSVEEGVTEDQLAAIERWRSTVLGVAAQEMLHLGLDGQHVDLAGRVPTLVTAESAPTRPALPCLGPTRPPAVR